MGDVIHIGPRPATPKPAPIPPRVSLRECARRAELVVATGAALSRACAAEPRVTLGLRSDGKPIDDRSWEVVCSVDGGPERRIHGPVHSDDVDMLLGCVLATAARWVDVQRRRLAMRAL